MPTNQARFPAGATNGDFAAQNPVVVAPVLHIANHTCFTARRKSRLTVDIVLGGRYYAVLPVGESVSLEPFLVAVGLSIIAALLWLADSLDPKEHDDPDQ